MEEREKKEGAENLEGGDLEKVGIGLLWEKGNVTHSNSREGQEDPRQTLVA